MSQIGLIPFYRAVDTNGSPLPNARLYTFLTGTTTPAPTYTTDALNVSHGPYVQADANGLFPAFYPDPTVTYRYQLRISPYSAAVSGCDADPVANLASSAVSFLQAGSGAVATTVQERERRTVRAFDFYSAAQKAACLAGTDVDVSAALTAAITYAKTLRAPHLIIDYGQHYLASGVTFDLPDSSTITFEGTILSSVSAGAAVQIGSASANISFLNVHGFKIVRTANDTAGTSIGLKLVNLVWAEVHVSRCGGFKEGVLCIGAGVGFAHNNVFLGALFNNRTTVRLSQSTTGYCNANRFYGGSFNHSDDYPAVSTTNLLIDHAAGTLALNNNVFFSPSFEDNADPAGGVIAATINGENNVLYSPRMENAVSPTTYLIQFTVNSSACQIIGAGLGLGLPNISDLGSRNCYDTADGTFMRSSTAAGTGKAVLTLQSISDSAARSLRILDAGGSEAAYVDGQGYWHAPRYYDSSGNLVLTTRKTGWSVATGTAARTAFDTATVTTEELAKRVKALIDDLHSTAGHGMIDT